MYMYWRVHYCCFVCGGTGEPDMDIHFNGALPSFFARAYHTRLSQHGTSEPEHHLASGRTLPQYHPLLIRHADHPQQVASRAVGGAVVHQDHAPNPHPHVGVTVSGASSGSHVVGVASGGGTVVDPHQHESVMQQLLSNISAAAGTNEVLGFGVSSTAGVQRPRGML